MKLRSTTNLSASQTDTRMPHTRSGLQLPDLSISDVKFGANETPWNLNILLYEGAAATRKNLVAQLIASGALGRPLYDRLELLVKLHEEISGPQGSGGSRETASNQFLYLRMLFAFADHSRLPLTLESVTETYCGWADFLFHRTRIKKGTHTNMQRRKRQSLSMRSAYSYASTVGTLLDRVLVRNTPIIELTRLVYRRQRKTATGVQAEKQNLKDTFVFGHLLQDICDGLPLRVILDEPMPIQLTLRSGSTLSRKGATGYARTEQEVNLGDRYPFANLRIEAELLMFIAQTGMNLAQASNLELRQFFYVSHLDGYQVKDHKNRRGGAVLFEIFKDYKLHFERYLAWRRSLFPHSDRLFPFIKFLGTREDTKFSGHRIRGICKELNIAFVSPRSLRNTRVNWLLRKSGDPDLTAEMAQHAEETLLKVYDRPSVQRASVETLRFWSKFDPHLAKTQSVAPGDCTGNPKPLLPTSKDGPKPDCRTASGCLWCENHRDVDSLDYVWALTSFQHLKVIELSKARLPKREEDVPPAQRAIDRIHEKLAWFEQSNECRKKWVHESQALVAEGDFHPNFRGEITELESAA
ncbi:integrase [Paraburkholderia youngii]|uniref:site-specific integrase n=1 Tax=Paraburkholderia youngii TaxID=2782701 RepID=UPI003D1D8557